MKHDVRTSSGVLGSVFLLLVLGCITGRAEARPGWAERYLQEDQPEWSEWRNSLAPEGPTEKLRLAEEGSTDYVIVVPEEASAQERRAASELQLWLGKITGADFPIRSDRTKPTPHELSVGTTNRRGPSARAAERTAGEHGYALHVDGKRLFFLGEGGPLNAVMAFLEEDLGVRWYTGPSLKGWSEIKDALRARPWHDGGVVRFPEDDSLTASVVPRVRKPGIPLRRTAWRYSYRPLGLRNRINFGYEKQYDYQQGFASGNLGAHTFYQLVPPEKHFDEHPEYFAKVNGKRRREHAQLCLTEKPVARIAARNAIKILKQRPPSHRFIVVNPEDNRRICECQDCRAIQEETGSYSGLLIRFVNRVAERVAREVPDATLISLAYWTTRKPPEVDIQVRDNVAIQLALDRGAQFDWPYHSYYDEKFSDPEAVRKHPHVNFPDRPETDLFARWREISPRMMFWMYPSQYRNTYAPMPNEFALAENLQFAAEKNAEMVYVQSAGSDLPRQRMRAWVTSKLLWNPNLDVDALTRDFIYGYYGDAAGEVAAYNDLLYRQAARYTDFDRRRHWIYPIHNEGMFRHGFVEKARAILNRGISKADRDAVRHRVKLLKIGVVFVEAARLFVRMRDDEKPPDRERYDSVQRELSQMSRELEIGTLDVYGTSSNIKFYDGNQTIGSTEEFINAMEQEKKRRLDQ